MFSLTQSWANPESYGADYSTREPIANLGYGGFILLLQNIGIKLKALKAAQAGVPVGEGAYFSVTRHAVTPENVSSLSCHISSNPVYKTPRPKLGTLVAFKRLKPILDDAGNID